MSLINPQNIQIPNLPCALFENWKEVPEQPGIYFITCAQNGLLLYIGCSRSLRQRMLTHDKKVAFARYGTTLVYWLLIDEIGQLTTYERACINVWRPLLNDGGPNPQRPGPRPKGFKRYNIFLPEDILVWAKQQPEGMSALIRKLLAEERQRRTASP